MEPRKKYVPEPLELTPPQKTFIANHTRMSTRAVADLLHISNERVRRYRDELYNQKKSA